MTHNSSTQAEARESFWHEDDTVVPTVPALRLDDLLDWAVAQAPDREALVFLPDKGAPHTRWTYRELVAQVDNAARALLASGVGRGGAIAVFAANRPEFVVLQYACARIGATTVAVNPDYTAADLSYVLNRARVQICFADHRNGSAVLWEILDEVASTVRSLRLRVALSSESDHDTHWTEWVSRGVEIDPAELRDARAAASPDDVIEIQFTSGTTGHPKGVRLRSNAMANGGRNVAHRAGILGPCRTVHAMPFFHVGATVSSMSSALSVAGTHIFLPRFSPAGLCAAIADEGATVIAAVPTMLISLAEHAITHGYSMRTLRTIITGGSLVPESVAGN